jgi:hypothetical protein
MEPEREIISRTVHETGTRWRIMKVAERIIEGVGAKLNTDYEIEGERTTDALKALSDARFAESPPWQYYAMQFPESRKKMLDFFEHYCNAENSRISTAAVMGRKHFNDAADESKPVEERLEGAFMAGKHYAEVLAYASDRDALHGRKANSATKGMRNRKPTPLRTQIEQAWCDFQDENPEGSKSDFMAWLGVDGADYSLCVDGDSICLNGCDESLKIDTISRWLKKN